MVNKIFRFRRKKEVESINARKELFGGSSFVDSQKIPKSENKSFISPSRLFIKRKNK